MLCDTLECIPKNEPHFRAFDAKNNRMIYYTWGDLVAGAVATTYDNHDVPSNIANLISIAEYDYSESMRMKGTGLTDKVGTEMFDGDICKMIIFEYPENSNPIEALLVVIEWKNACWGFKHLFPELVCEDDRGWQSFWCDDSRDMWATSYFEVVGNIHENTEMLPDFEEEMF